MVDVAYCVTDDQSLVWRLLAHVYRERYGQEPPRIVKEDSGKPVFASAPGRHFSISHTKGAVLVVLADAPCGGDIELVRPVRDALARRVASRRELDEFDFIDLWVVKEGCVKLAGSVPGGEVYEYMRACEVERSADGVVVPWCGAVARFYDLGRWRASAVLSGRRVPCEIRAVSEGDLV